MGQFQQFVSNETVTVKIITVQPGHRLSLQSTSTAARCGRSSTCRSTSPSTTAVAGPARRDRLGAPRRDHRMGNPRHRSPVGCSKSAFGHFDESDIERLEDDYAR